MENEVAVEMGLEVCGNNAFGVLRLRFAQGAVPHFALDDRLMRQVMTDCSFWLTLGGKAGGLARVRGSPLIAPKSGTMNGAPGAFGLVSSRW